MSCFGMSTEEADRMLDAYLGDAVAQPLKLVPQAPVEFPWVEPRDATDAEQARILGDWERKELEFVRASHDEFAAGYASQAERTFMGAYERGERDPELLAAIGIYRCALGETGAARALLEEAVRGGTARPRAYVELARLRLGEALEKPAGSGGTLDPGQVSSILGLVRAGRDRLPPQHAAYAEAAEVLEHAQAAPTRADLILLAEGLRLFPRDAALALAVARLRAAAGENR
jgi:hypothetical protein